METWGHVCRAFQKEKATPAMEVVKVHQLVRRQPSHGLFTQPSGCHHPTHDTLRLGDPAEFSHQVQLVQLVVPGFSWTPLPGL